MVSVIALPLYARGELLGVMSLALSGLTDRNGRRYGTDDRDLFGAIASRIAIAIDNAMLFEAERRTALAFQESLLPQELPRLDGLEVACRYVPAGPLETHGQGIQTQVGGDWYDVIPLAAGRVGIVIGDVEGRGARAAAVMGQLRAALRAFAQDEKAPADILRKLDEWCRTMVPAGADPRAPGAPTCSCTYFVYDPWTRELTFANAGHDAPLLVDGGRTSQLDVGDKGVLLGVRGQGISGLPTYKEESLILPAGATLVLYTDGLTDRRARADGAGHYTEDEALAMLCDAVSTAAGGSADRIARAAEESVPGDIDDDMAIVVVRSLPDELDARERVFPAEPVMVSEARRMALDTFQDWGMDSAQAELACLLVSEVVTNAVLHTAAAASPRRGLEDFDLDPAPTVAGPAGHGRSGGGRSGRGRVHGTGARGRLGATGSGRDPRGGRRSAPPRTSPCGCAAAHRRSGWRCSTPTCGCRGSGPRKRATKVAAASTWSSSSPPAGVRDRPATVRPCGSRCRSTAGRPGPA